MRVADSASSLLYLQKILNLYVYKAINFALLKTRIVKEMLTCKCKEGKQMLKHNLLMFMRGSVSFTQTDGAVEICG